MRPDRVGAPPVGQHGVVVGGGPEEDPDAAVAQAAGDDPGVLKGFPAQFERQPVLRIDLCGLPSGDAEELRVEAVDVVEVAAVEVASACRCRAEGVPALGQQPPERPGVRRAGQSAAQPDHRHGTACGTARFHSPPPREIREPPSGNPLSQHGARTG